MTSFTGQVGRNLHITQKLGAEKKADTATNNKTKIVAGVIAVAAVATGAYLAISPTALPNLTKFFAGLFGQPVKRFDPCAHLNAAGTSAGQKAHWECLQKLVGPRFADGSF